MTFCLNSFLCCLRDSPSPPARLLSSSLSDLSTTAPISSSDHFFCRQFWGGFERLTLSLYLSHCESPYFENLATTQNIEEGKFRFPLLAFLTVPALTGQTGVAHQEEREERRGQLECGMVRELYSSGDSQQRIVDHLIACFALLYCTVLYCTVAPHYQVLLSSKNSFNIICTEWWGVQMDTTPSNSLETQIITKMHFILSTWLERSTVTPYWTFHNFDCFDQTFHYWNSI